ncbi:hypothetical protein AB0J28_18505 [Streptosporangium canum]|uniref:hypothetical protein n=1 Tax=Streptosporangium canum TaxID=324952 RepID=UPI003449F4BB
MMTTDCTVRAEFVAGLRRLADFLAANPKAPVPSYGAGITLHASGTDEERFAEVDRVADLIGVPASEGVHYSTERDFGPVSYRAVAIPAEERARHEAGMSYYDAITA